MKRWFSAIALLTFMFVSAYTARAQQEELTIVIVGRGDNAFKELISKYEMKTGRKVTAKILAFVPSRDAIVKGEPFDVGVVEYPHDEDVIASGNVVVNSETSIANGEIGVAVRHGAPKPDISTPAALKRTLLSAKSIAFPDPENGTGASGVHTIEALRRLGIWEQIKGKTKLTQGGGRAMTMVANGDVEIGLTYLIGMGGDQEKPGLIDIVGTLPAAIAPPTPLLGFVSSKTKYPEASKELLDFLATPEAKTTFSQHWMLPGY
jgi:molybdate transport system substrate-binding protein